QTVPMKLSFVTISPFSKAVGICGSGRALSAEPFCWLQEMETVPVRNSIAIFLKFIMLNFKDWFDKNQPAYLPLPIHTQASNRSVYGSLRQSKTTLSFLHGLLCQKPHLSCILYQPCVPRS